MLDAFMQEFAHELGVGEALATSKPGIYQLPLEESISIVFSSIQNGFVLNCELGKCPIHNREVFFTQALLADLFGQGTHGAILGLSEDGNTLTLSKSVDYNINYKKFREILEDFINVVDYWHGEALAHK